MNVLVPCTAFLVEHHVKMLQITEILYLSQKHLVGNSYQTSVILPFQQSVIPKDATRSSNCRENLKVPALQCNMTTMFSSWNIISSLMPLHTCQETKIIIWNVITYYHINLNNEHLHPAERYKLYRTVMQNLSDHCLHAAASRHIQTYSLITISGTTVHSADLLRPHCLGTLTDITDLQWTWCLGP
jgi:hypothetical protein